MKNSYFWKLFSKASIENQDDRLVIATNGMGRVFLKRLGFISIIPIVASVSLWWFVGRNSNTGSPLTLTCDPVEDYVNCAYQQVGFDGKLIAELEIPRATYSAVNVSHSEVCGEDSCYDVTYCELYIVGRNGSQQIPFETFNKSDKNCTQENLLQKNITQLIKGERKVAVFQVQDNGYADLWPFAIGILNKIWLTAGICLGLSSLTIKQHIWTFDRSSQSFVSEQKRPWGNRTQRFGLAELTGVYSFLTRLRLSVQVGENLQGKTIEMDRIQPWLNPTHRVLRASNYSTEITLEITPTQLRFLYEKKIHFSVTDQRYFLWYSPFSGKSIEGDIQEIKAIVLEEKLPDSDGDVLGRISLEIDVEKGTETLKLYPLFNHYELVNLKPLAETIADYLKVPLKTSCPD